MKLGSTTQMLPEKKKKALVWRMNSTPATGHSGSHHTISQIQGPCQPIIRDLAVSDQTNCIQVPPRSKKFEYTNIFSLSLQKKKINLHIHKSRKYKPIKKVPIGNHEVRLTIYYTVIMQSSRTKIHT